MLKRLIVVLLLGLTPVTALADDTPTPEATPAQTPAANAAQPDPATSALGPSSTNSAGGSSADAAALQPAGGSPLQSTTADSTGLTAPTANTLQAPAGTDDALKVLAGEADGTSHNPSEGTSYWGWLWWTLILAALVTAVAYILRRRPFRQAKSHSKH
jgi:hypothetical protein